MPDFRDLHRKLRDAPLALTIDDAPTVAASPGGAFPDPARMDRMREALQRAGVRHCVAFVVGREAERETARLRRWLDAGYELGNHTWSHHPSSAYEPEAVLEDIRRCDALLGDVGAFLAGRPRWFRFPYLDRGRGMRRQALHEGIGALGYRVVHGTIDWFDHRYEEPLSRAVQQDNERAALRIERRAFVTALRGTAFEVAFARRLLGRPVAHIAYCHFGEVCVRALASLLVALRAAEARLCSLEEAIADPIYAAFDQPPLRTGRVPPALFRRGPWTRARRLAAGLSAGVGLFGQARLGPLWPHLD